MIVVLVVHLVLLVLGIISGWLIRVVFLGSVELRIPSPDEYVMTVGIPRSVQKEWD